jgi:hypothetical protein
METINTFATFNNIYALMLKLFGWFWWIRVGRPCAKVG